MSGELKGRSGPPRFFSLFAALKKPAALLLVFAFFLQLALPTYAQESSEAEVSGEAPVSETKLVPEEEISVDSPEDVPPEEPPALSSLVVSAPGEGSNTARPPTLPNIDEVTGALQYQYMLEVPPGRNNLTPDMRLVYQSQTKRNGVFGMGWYVDIPYIQRANKTGIDRLYTDNNFISSMDGELVATSSSYYQAKVENGSFLKYKFSSNHWIVTDTRGVTYTFGAASSTQQYSASTTANVYRWMLQEIRDANGNYITYEYYKDEGQIYPSVITYTGHGVTPGIFSVEFDREARSDELTSYESGFKVKTRYRISEIRAEINGQWVRKYALTYASADNSALSVLDTVTESGRDDQANVITLPSAEFAYQQATEGWTYEEGWRLPIPFSEYDDEYHDSGMRLTDYNGDGLLDIVCANQVNDSWCSGIEFMENDGSGWTTDTSWTMPNRADSPGNPEYIVGSGWTNRGIMFVDVNGDGLDDIVRGLGYGYVYINNGVSTWEYDGDWHLPIAYMYGEGDQGLRMADINGDGLIDLICANEVNNTECGPSEPDIYLNTGSGWSTSTPSWNLPIAILDDEYYDRGVRLADINGDGLADVLHSESGGHVYINNGASWVVDPAWTLPAPFTINGGDSGGRLADINGDGLLDIICSNPEEEEPCGEESGHVIRYNTGSGWSATTPAGWSLPYELAGNGGEDLGIRVADLNGDGLPDLVRRTDVANSAWINNSSVRTDYLNYVRTNKGAETEITYKPTTKFTSGSDYTINPALQTVTDVVLAISHDDGFNDLQTFTYSYEGGDYYFEDYLNRKFAGFSKVSATDGAGFSTETFYHQGNATASTTGEYADDVSKIGKVYRIDTYDGSDNLYQSVITKWESHDLGNDADFVKTTTNLVLAYDGDGDHKDSAETYAYNNSAGTLAQKTEWGEVTGSANGTFSDAGSDKFTTSYSYATSTATSTTLYLSQETTIDQSSSKVREKKHYYDGLSFGQLAKGNPTKTEQWKASSSYASTTASYTAFGLVASSTDARGKTTSFVYDPHNLYPATTTNPLGHTIAWSYDYSSGKAATTTDANGKRFVIAYDGLDRPLTEKQPQSATSTALVTKKTYAYTDTIGSRKVVETNHLDGSTDVTLHTYLDGLSRKIQTRQEAEGSNQYAVRDFVYDDRGLLWKESLPYFSSGSSKTSSTGTSALYTTYAYDPLQRVLSVTNVEGATTNAYDQWKTTTTDAEANVKEVTQDAYGSLASVIEHDGVNAYTTSYQYDGNKNLTRLTDADGNVRNFTYDGMGRRLTAQDLHDTGDGTYGTWTYTYDDAGNMTSQVDPKSQTVNFTYDNLNRVLTEDYTGQAGTEILYGYDSCVEGKGRLCAATTTAAVTNYTYNALGFPATEKKTINGSSYTASYVYDRQGNTTNLTYPDGSEVRYAYNTAGQLETVEQKESGGSFGSIVSDLDYGPHGKITFKEFGNGVTSEYTYDANELYRLKRILTLAPEGGGMGFAEDPFKTLARFLNPQLLATEEVVLTEEDFSEPTPVETHTVPEESTAPVPDAMTDGLLEESTELQEGEMATTSPGESPDIPALSGEEATSTPETEAPEPVMEETASTTEEAVPVADPEPLQEKLTAEGLVKNEEQAKAWRTYHEERVAYLESRKDLPPEALEAALYAKERYEGYLLEKGYIEEKEAEIRALPETFDIGEISWGLLKRALKLFLPEKAYAYLFGKEDFESCVSLPCSFNANEAWGGVTPSLDSTSKVAGVDSLKETVTGEGSGALMKSGLSNSELYAQAKIFVPSPMNFGASGYMTVMMFTDSSDNPKLWLSLENYGTPRLIVDGNTLAYTDTGLNLTAGAVNTIEFRGKVNSSTGDVDIWLNNSTQGSPSYNGSGSLNTGTGNIGKATATAYYVPENGYSTLYFDDIIFDTSFIGSGAPVNSAPTAPSSLLLEGQSSPASSTDPTPEFSAIFNDPDASDTATKYRIQVATSTAFASFLWDTGTTTLASSTPQGQRIADISYAGTALASSTMYYWRIKFWDNANAEGAWSTATSTFSLASSTSPSGPVSVQVIQDISYAYDAVGNITSITDISGTGVAKTLAFGYDDLYRLTSASTAAASSTPFSHSYAYGPIGNITSMSGQGSYTYAETSYANPHAPTSINGTSLTYDNNGNVTAYSPWTYAWDYRNRLATSTNGTSVTYAYDHLNQRVKKVAAGTTTVYPNKFYDIAGTDITKHVFAGNELVATVSAGTGGGGGTSTTTTHTLFSDATTWEDWSWDSTIDFNETGTVYQGTKSIEITHTAGWGGLYLRKAAGVSTATSTHLSFAVRSTATNPVMEIGSYGPSDAELEYVGLSSYIPGGSIAANTWYQVAIPLEDLEVDNTTLTGITVIKETTGTTFVDDVKLIAVSEGGEGDTATTTSYIHVDHLGGTNVTTNAEAEVESVTDYYPYGAERIATGDPATDRGYIGERTDDETGMNYLNARYLQNQRGQFISQDPVFWEVGQTQDGRAVLQNPQAQNSYSYAQNSPLVNKDPTGRIGIGFGFNGTLGAPGLYGGGSTYAVLTVNPYPFNVEVGIISSADGGGSTAIGGVGATGGVLLTNARDIGELEGPGAVVGGSVRAGANVGVDVGLSGTRNPNRTVVTVNPNVGVGLSATPYGVPAEVHGGAGYTTAIARANVTQAVTNAANATRTSIQNQINNISRQIKEIQRSIDRLKSNNTKKNN